MGAPVVLERALRPAGFTSDVGGIQPRHPARGLGRRLPGRRRKVGGRGGESETEQEMAHEWTDAGPAAVSHRGKGR